MTENFPLPCSLILAVSQVHYNAVERNSGTNNLQCNKCFFGGVITKLKDKHTIYCVYEKNNINFIHFQTFICKCIICKRSQLFSLVCIFDFFIPVVNLHYVIKQKRWSIRPKSLQ